MQLIGKIYCNEKSVVDWSLCLCLCLCDVVMQLIGKIGCYELKSHVTVKGLSKFKG